MLEEESTGKEENKIMHAQCISDAVMVVRTLPRCFFLHRSMHGGFTVLAVIAMLIAMFSS